MTVSGAAASLSQGPTQGPGPWFREHDVALADVTLRVAIGPPNGDPFVWIHGVGRSWRDAAPLLSALLPRWSIIAPDLRGHGGSSHTPGKYLIRDFLGDVKVLLQQIDRPAVIYGHSLGAMLAALVAAACPDRVRAIIAEDPPSPAYLEQLHLTPYEPLFRAMQRLAGSTRDVSAIARELGDVVVRNDAAGVLRLRDIRDGAAIRFSARWLCDLDPTVYTPILERHWRDGLEFPEVWSRVRCPTLLLAGDEAAGGMLPAADARDIMNRLADGTLIDFPRVGHQIHWLAQEAALRAVLGFVESL
ncbi:MAG: alpha/beta hydrolase [Planctomycetia bacterium]|nr:alpha/beta hydrolase [Planctomycetia bacterium]